MHRLQLERVVWAPAGSPPHKAHLRVSPASCRLDMLRLAVENNSKFEIDEIELRLEGSSYTARTLMAMHDKYGESRLRFMIGSDEFANLSEWRQPEVVIQFAELIVMVRSGVSFDPGAVEAKLPAVVGRYELTPAPDLPLSSSDLRTRVRTGLPIRYLVPDAVRSYIYEHRLYTEEG